MTGGVADLDISIEPADMAKESDGAGDEGYVESLCALRKLAEAMPAFGGFLLHGSVIAYEDRGIAFLAPSGVGKTTHTLLWKGCFDVTIINGDKPFLRFEKGVPYAYGTPWAGKEGFKTNRRVRLTDICFIEQAQENETIPMEQSSAAPLLLQQIMIPREASGALKTLQLADALCKQVSFYKIRCNMEKEAAQVACRRITGE